VTHAMRKRINRMLGEHGLAQLDDPGLHGQLAYLVRDHDHFRSLLITAPPEHRGLMYDAWAPNLRFKAHTLEQYLMEARADAEARQLPIQAEDGTLKPYNVAEIHSDVTRTNSDELGRASTANLYIADTTPHRDSDELGQNSDFTRTNSDALDPFSS